MIIEWKSEYETSNPIIDEQHRLVFILINMLLKATDKKDQIKCIMELYKYIRYHFEYEESLMRFMCNIDYKEHVEKHTAMITKLNLVSEQIANNTLDKLKLNRFIYDWTINHIGTECKQFKNFYSIHVPP